MRHFENRLQRQAPYPGFNTRLKHGISEMTRLILKFQPPVAIESENESVYTGT